MLNGIWQHRIKTKWLVFIWLSSMGLASALAARQEFPPDLLPVEALQKLEESAVSDCAICARQLQKEAFEMLSFALEPGRMIQTSPTCLLRGDSFKASNLLIFVCRAGQVPEPQTASATYPQVVFRFHTDRNHLVGIDQDDYTLQRVTSLYRNAPPNSLFAGTLEIISFAYGNGPSFMYLASEHQLLIHCRIVDLRIQNP
jgi:hypothetical protein